MKALASEIVRKLGKRLKWLSIHVRELTGGFLPHATDATSGLLRLRVAGA